MNYPFIKCLNPKRIINPTTGEHLIVPCGSCPACSMRKSAQNAFRCKLESCSHKFCMFVTLTYNNASLPRLIVKAVNRSLTEDGDVHDTFEPFALVDVTQRLMTQGTILGRCYNTYTLYSLSRKVNMPHRVLPHLSKIDLQLFLKRLRRNLDTYYKKKYETEAEKIRYYAVGEYGPVHFRPHYHLMLWFSDQRTYEAIGEIVHKSWTFGRIDIQKSQGKCADYVAKYLNCNVSLPKVLKEFGTRPFSLHSTYLGEKVLEASYEKVYQSPYNDVVTRVLPSIAGDSKLFLWRSLKTWYFPKCKGYAVKSQYERLFSYSTYAVLRKWSKEDSCSRLAYIVLYYAFCVIFHHASDLPDDIPLDVIEYFIDSCNIYEVVESDFESYYIRIYSELRTSKHFHDLSLVVSGGNYEKFLKIVTEFWADDDLFNLNTQYKQMEEYGNSEWYESDADYDFFYFNRGFDFEKFKQIKAFRLFNQATSCNFVNSVKHKKLNDLNKVFNDK